MKKKWKTVCPGIYTQSKSGRLLVRVRYHHTPCARMFAADKLHLAKAWQKIAINVMKTVPANQLDEAREYLLAIPEERLHRKEAA